MSRPGYWTTKDKRELLIADMESTHIANCLRLLQRHAPTYKAFEDLRMFFSGAPDEVRRSQEDASPRIFMIAVHASYNDLTDEAEKRGMDVVNDPWQESDEYQTKKAANIALKAFIQAHKKVKENEVLEGLSSAYENPDKRPV